MSASTLPDNIFESLYGQTNFPKRFDDIRSTLQNREDIIAQAEKQLGKVYSGCGNRFVIGAIRLYFYKRLILSPESAWEDVMRLCHRAKSALQSEAVQDD